MEFENLTPKEHIQIRFSSVLSAYLNGYKVTVDPYGYCQLDENGNSEIIDSKCSISSIFNENDNEESIGNEIVIEIKIKEKPKNWYTLEL